MKRQSTNMTTLRGPINVGPRHYLVVRPMYKAHRRNPCAYFYTVYRWGFFMADFHSRQYTPMEAAEISLGQLKKLAMGEIVCQELFK